MSDRPELVQFTGQQRALRSALGERDSSLACIYFGALIVLEHAHNPDRFALAAHGIRELMEKMPELLGLQMKAQGESLKAKVRELQTSWNSALKNTQCCRDAVWEGQIDKALKKLLERCRCFFDWFDQHTPRRRDEFANALRVLDVSGRDLPGPLEHLNVQAWDNMRDFFQSVAHHRSSPTADEFHRWLAALEQFLLDRLRPRTFADLDILDQLIREGEGRD